MTEPRDFTLPMEPKQFRIDQDVFNAPAIMSPIALKKLAKLHADLAGEDLTQDIDRTLDRVGEMFAIFLPGESGVRFQARLLSETEPIDLTRQALPILYWLLEEYGMRPTGPSSPSLNGLTDGQTDTPNGGMSSTDGASPDASPIST